MGFASKTLDEGAVRAATRGPAVAARWSGRRFG